MGQANEPSCPTPPKRTRSCSTRCQSVWERCTNYLWGLFVETQGVYWWETHTGTRSEQNRLEASGCCAPGNDLDIKEQISITNVAVVRRECWWMIQREPHLNARKLYVSIFRNIWKVYGMGTTSLQSQFSRFINFCPEKRCTGQSLRCEWTVVSVWMSESSVHPHGAVGVREKQHQKNCHEKVKRSNSLPMLLLLCVDFRTP